MVNITPFKFKHLSHLVELFESNKSSDAKVIKMKTLPKVGYITYYNDIPVAAGFLRRVEPCYAQVDTLVSNPYLGSIIRHEAISKIMDALINDAKRLKLEGLIAHTQDKGTLLRAESLGFHVVPQTIIALPLPKE